MITAAEFIKQNTHLTNEEMLYAFAKVYAETHDDIVDENIDVEPKLVGSLTKPFGIKGYIKAEVGHPVYDSGNRYIIILKHETLTDLHVPFYYDSLKTFIKFND